MGVDKDHPDQVEDFLSFLKPFLITEALNKQDI